MGGSWVMVSRYFVLLYFVSSCNFLAGKKLAGCYTLVAF